MNYAAVFLVFILGASTVYWYISGRKFYHGPLIEAQAGEDYEESGGETATSIEKKDKLDV